jgi:hypothetical protein
MKIIVFTLIVFIVCAFLIVKFDPFTRICEGPQNDYDIRCTDDFVELEGIYHDARLLQVNGVWQVTTNNGHIYYLPLAHCAVGYYE